ncbi:2-keto-4-pentenoate hydratase/2-oxohepta-3-ene-1,7-dioic acid hydratase (catechol pathway) [Alkalispirochaeta americana]|uniref:2-keto-4-pentenoate hydratase/2-oxohepta-3-ene-1,7-dioic acid hydratase (Catechol pathway) n=1 Tax=Alkalispirochaeta americana TaxID=159291 RepID=A0A1N6QUL3_9SPIO|nr:fumarylacetoacetate hydrolase family protein [Alkalispirochaeta americana]SIQ20212.1 2-keto-4-pentenoate hydratase/2-oxohepta-3-ene-1,7-dioic acid hydratase (catechol pathway) [Alkalispirochaeta americana]
MKKVLNLPCAGGGTYAVQPEKVIALGLNYREHIQESLSVKVRGFGTDEPPEPVLFPKLPSSIIGPHEAIRLPLILDDYSFEEERTDYEGELAIIIGRDGFDISPARAGEYIFGFTCANDVSQRNLQNGDRSGWFRGKSFDTFLPLGPRIVSSRDIPNPQDLEIVTRCNGRVVQRGSTAQMITPIAEIISFVSRNFTLREGDIILTGTPAGVGPLIHNDVIEVEIEGIGLLKNPVLDPRHN